MRKVLCYFLSLLFSCILLSSCTSGKPTPPTWRLGGDTISGYEAIILEKDWDRRYNTDWEYALMLRRNDTQQVGIAYVTYDEYVSLHVGDTVRVFIE